ncbi:MAG: zinc-ribbon domain-containing protein [Candidatus Methanosuratincola sp.]
MEDRTCAKCGRELPADAAFCPSCGSPVQREAPKTYTAVRQRELAGPLFGGGVLVVLGSTFWLATTGVISWAIWWAYFLCGLGVLLVLLGIHNARSGKDSGPITGGVVVLAIGIIAILAWNYSLSSWWPLVLIAIGLVVIVSALLAHRITRR